ncbi:MAG: cation diffusion facilitator family transporter [Solirubrobacterales bacterium]|nr:cation diffusion facilitator family transporter [Solirubrobacterales bacterium]
MHGPGHSHAPMDEDVLRSREGVRAVVQSLVVLLITAGAQGAVFFWSGSVALLADLIHNVGDALTAVPVGVAFLLHSKRAEKWAGMAVVAAILVSGLIAGYEAISRFISPEPVTHLPAVALAGVLGYVGNRWVSLIRLRAGEKINSPALIADGEHARADAIVSLGVVATAAVVAVGLPVADPIIGLLITVGILRITWQSWALVRA